MPKGASTEEPVAPAPAPAPAPAAPAEAKPAGATTRKSAAKKAAPALPAPSTKELLEASRQWSAAMEAVGRIEKLRREGQIGTAPRPDVLLSKSATQYASMQPMTIPGERKPSRTGGTLTAQPRVVAPTRAPTPVDLGKTREDLLKEARGVAAQFGAAIRERDAAQAAVSTAIQGGRVEAKDMPALAAEQRKRLEAVLSLAAQMREYGYVGSNEELMTQFAPK